MSSSPFASPPSSPGHGLIFLSLLLPNTPRLRTVSYQYPLKLVSPAPLRLNNDDAALVHTVYLLTYGGGLVAGDTIDLHVILESSTRLILLTQGSTKLFKSPSRDILSKQSLDISLAPGSALCYLPDPVQPFEMSNFEQQQTYNISVSHSSDSDNSGLCVLDWVSNGRPANGENWSFWHYASRNEIYLSTDGKQKLLLRDNMLLNDQAVGGNIVHRMAGLAVYGTLILYGPLLQNLGQFFLNEFRLLPRIGGRKWDSEDGSDNEDADPQVSRRAERHRAETTNGLLWSAASVRGCVVVKFGAPALEAGRVWLYTMLTEEASVVSHFGERSLMCLR